MTALKPGLVRPKERNPGDRSFLIAYALVAAANRELQKTTRDKAKGLFLGKDVYGRVLQTDGNAGKGYPKDLMNVIMMSIRKYTA